MVAAGRWPAIKGGPGHRQQGSFPPPHYYAFFQFMPPSFYVEYHEV